MSNVNWSDPWSIIGWGIVYVTVFVVVAWLTIVLGIGVVTLVAQLRRKRKWRKANEGTLRCEMKRCTNKAAYRTPNGFSCVDHRKEMAKKYVGFASSFAWSTPLNWTGKQ